MKTLHLSTIIVLVISTMVTTSVFAQNATNSSNSIPPIPSSILHSPVPTLSSSENQTVVSIALSVPELQNWSHDWKYLGMGFGSNNKAASGDFEWQYASVVLKTPSSSAPIACSNDWQATVVVDMTTMKVVSATYPTMESHPCEVVTLREPATSSVFAENDTLKIGPPASNISIQEVNAGENNQWSSLPIFGAIGGVIVVTILVYVIKTRKRKTIK